MEMQFSRSVITAMDGLMRLHRGEFRSAPIQPVWCNFLFPTSLKAGPIKEEEHRPNGRLAYGFLTREVEFFYRGTRIATVVLYGVRFRGASSDDEFQWGVSQIMYLPKAGAGEQDESVDYETVYVDEGP